MSSASRLSVCIHCSRPDPDCVCGPVTRPPTKRDCAYALSNLIDRFGSRLVLECVADYLRKFLGLDLWADRYAAANAELHPEKGAADELPV